MERDRACVRWSLMWQDNKSLLNVWFIHRHRLQKWMDFADLMSSFKRHRSWKGVCEFWFSWLFSCSIRIMQWIVTRNGFSSRQKVISFRSLSVYAKCLRLCHRYSRRITLANRSHGGINPLLTSFDFNRCSSSLVSMIRRNVYLTCELIL